MDGTYHDESYGEQMEAQDGPYDHNEPPMLFPSDVDAALRRIEEAVGQRETLAPWVPNIAIIEIKNAIAQERERLGLSAEVKA